MVQIQPCDWQESDVDFKYVVDVYGRTPEKEVVCLRITGFQPYFYLKSCEGETTAKIRNALSNLSGKRLHDLRITSELKLDAMEGFNGLEPTRVWKLTCSALWMYKTVAKTLKNSMKIGTRQVKTEDIYEANLPSLLRLFHDQNLNPASPIEFEGDETDPEDDMNVDAFYTSHYKDVKPCSGTIPLYIAGYDIETYSESGNFPVSSNPSDEIIQIGVSFRSTDNLMQSKKRYVFVSGTCESSGDPNLSFVSCRNEKDLLKQFEQCIRNENPDILAGYNTFGFDDSYIADRAAYNKIPLQFGRYDYSKWKDDYVKTERKTFELASGKFAVRYIIMSGRLSIDLYLSMRREQNLDSYKLDSVSNTFLRDKVTSVVESSGVWTQQYEIHTKSTRGLFAGNLVRFDIVTNTLNPYRDGFKFYVKEVKPTSFIVEYTNLFHDLSAHDMKKLEWSFAKDDVNVTEMFASHHGTPDDRAVIAKYCIQDCDLVLTLMAKLDTLVNACGMADVCHVPIQYIFLRGQGIKIYSAVVYNASKRNQIIMAQEGLEGDAGYEGAIVLPPKIGMYLDQPIPVLDFNSLYPSNMIAYNLSPDTLAYVKNYDSNGRLLNPDSAKKFEGHIVDEVSYDIKNDEGEPIGRQVCGFVQPNENPQTIGLLPLTLDILLKKRKETRKKIETTEDDAQKSVLNGLQLAYKVVANSVYGQCGSKTSPIRRMEVAASTTAVGRQKIYDAKKIIETEFGGEVIYGDTDSVFVKFQTKSLSESMELARKSAERITASGRKAHKIEYEKTFYPFVLFCRKRYVGMMYEDDVHKCKRKSMGIAVKRRDNAPIVKDVFGGALDILMEERDIRKAQSFVQEMLVKVMKNEMPLDKFIVTKQLRDDYKNPGQIAHAVLAERMKERDEGSAPQVGDRLAYIYVAERKDKKKQGDKIEQVDYARQKGLKPDTEFYITNQLQNPLAQLFALALEDLDGYVPKVNYKRLLEETIEAGMVDEEDATLKILKMKEKELDKMMFMGAPYLNKHKKGPMDSYFKR
jgi:DNA polymerase elongation subunit (family B)